jgi:hypothetical protein
LKNYSKNEKKIMSTLEEFKSTFKAIIKILAYEEITPESDDYFREKYSKEPELYICPFEMFNCFDNSYNKLKIITSITTGFAKFSGAIEVLKSQLNDATTEEEKVKILAKIDNYSDELADEYNKTNAEIDEKEKERLSKYEIYITEEKENHKKKIDEWNLEKSLWIPLYLTDNDFEELFEEYKINSKKVINKIIKAHHYFWMPFRHTISLNLKFARSISSNDKIAKCIFDALKKPYGDRVEFLTNYDLNIEELLEVTKIFTNPPYPLINCQHEDEFEYDPSQQFDIVSNENLRYVIQAAKNNFEDGRLKQSNLVNICFSLPNGKFYKSISSNVMECYPEIDNNLIEVSNDNIIIQFIKGLYTGSFDRSISDKDADELYHLFTKFKLHSFALLCQLVPLIRSDEASTIISNTKDT